MDEEEEGVEPEAAPARGRSKVPIFVAAGVAAVALAGLVVWGLTRKPEPAAVATAPAPAAAPARPPPPVQAQPEPPPPPVKAEPAPPPPQPVQARVQPVQPPAAAQPPATVQPPPKETPAPPPKVVAAAPATTKGIRLVKPELNAIAVPAAASGAGVLAIQATPWAEVSIDGRPIGETPREVLLGAGAYRVRASHPDLGTRDTVVQVKPGKRQVLNLTFAK
jgi:hypothetical protein